MSTGSDWLAIQTGIVPLSLRETHPLLQCIGWTVYTFYTLIQNVSADHGRSYVSMAKQLLDRPNVVAHFQQMHIEAVE
jgi:hypothetical protein